jgi:hypothetical protein
MNRLNLFLLIACTGTSVAMAAPRESVDLVALNGGPIGSKDLPGSVNNTVLTVPFTGSDGGGAYTARYLNVSGTIGAVFSNSYFREAVVKITPPGGTPFFAQVVNAGASGTGAPVSGTGFVVPVSSFTTAGNWTFEFCDYFNDVDTGDFIDARWTAFSVSLDDGPVPAPAVGTGPSITSTNVAADGALGAGTNGVVNWSNATPSTHNGIRLSGIVTMGSANPAANLNANTTPDLRIKVTFPDGTSVTATPIVTNGLSSQAFDLSLPLSGSAVGNWTFTAYDNADIAGVTDLYLPVFTAEIAEFAPAGPITDVGVVGGEAVKTATFTTTDAIDVKWAKITTTADILAANAFYLDMDTEGTSMTGTGTGVNDTEMAIYSSLGVKLVEDDDDGSGPLSQISFGAAATPRAAIGDGTAYDGRDGASLPAGTYYVAAGSYNKNFNANFNVTHTASGITTGAAGTLLINFRSNLPVPPSQCSPADVGVQGGVEGHDNHLDNNDFIVFINYFFAHDARADLGSQGGVHAPDNAWDNNDFVVFIDYFFNDAANCHG